MSPGIGLMKRRIEDEKSAISLAISHVSKKYKIDPKNINVLETKFHADAGDWYVALVGYKKQSGYRWIRFLETRDRNKEI